MPIGFFNDARFRCVENIGPFANNGFTHGC